MYNVIAVLLTVEWSVIVNIYFWITRTSFQIFKKGESHCCLVTILLNIFQILKFSLYLRLVFRVMPDPHLFSIGKEMKNTDSV